MILKYYLFAIASFIYLLNFTMGIFEIPDNLPIIGNMDELAASALFLHSLKKINDHKKAKELQG